MANDMLQVLIMKKNTIPQIPFYFVRHGQTDWNLKNLIQGHIDIPLNEMGVDQARSVAVLLVNQGITQIISSPLARAHKTAEIINEILQVPLHVHEGLKERFLGKLEGTVKIQSALTNVTINYTQTAEGSEDVDDFKKRIANTLHEILNTDHVTLIVSHGGVYWALMDMLGFESQKSSNATPYFFHSHYFDPVKKIHKPKVNEVSSHKSK